MEGQTAAQLKTHEHTATCKTSDRNSAKTVEYRPTKGRMQPNRAGMRTSNTGNRNPRMATINPPNQLARHHHLGRQTSSPTAAAPSQKGHPTRNVTDTRSNQCNNSPNRLGIQTATSRRHGGRKIWMATVMPRDPNRSGHRPRSMHNSAAHNRRHQTINRALVMYGGHPR